MNSLKSLDLNLLLALDALIEERSVTRAAQRMGLSQPAMSHTLGRLRDWFGDELLVRSGAEMVPTARATALATPLRHQLQALETLLTPQTFDPAEATLTLKLATTDYAQLLLFPELVRRLQTDAPGIRVFARTYTADDRWEVLRQGEIDIAIGVFDLDAVPSDFFVQDLWDDTLISVLRADHPALDRPFDLDAFLSVSHLLVSPMGGKRGFIDDALEAQGLERHIAVWTQDFLTAPFILLATDCVITIPRLFAERISQHIGLAMRPAPVEPGWFTVRMMWHARSQNDPAQAWLRGVVKDAAEVR